MAGTTTQSTLYEFQPAAKDKKRGYSSISNSTTIHMSKRPKPDPSLEESLEEIMMTFGPVTVSTNFYESYPYVFTDLVTRGLELCESYDPCSLIPFIKVEENVLAYVDIDKFLFLPGNDLKAFLTQLEEKIKRSNGGRGTEWETIIKEIKERVEAEDRDAKIKLCQYKDSTHETIDLLIKFQGRGEQRDCYKPVNRREVLVQKEPLQQVSKAEIDVKAVKKEEERKKEPAKLEPPKIQDKIKERLESTRIIRRVTGAVESERNVSRPKPKVLRKSFI